MGYSNYDKVPIHIEPLGAGITDGAIEEIAGIPQLISLVIDYNTDQKVKEKIDKAWEELDSDKVVQYAKDFVKNRSVLYDTGSHHQIEYQSGKDVTALALAATGISATVKTLKESTEYVKDLVSLVKKKVDDGGSKLVTKLNLGKRLKTVGKYKVFENGEVFYRGMKKADYDKLLKGELPATSETFTSPTLEYITKKGYGAEGVIVKFKMKPGTIEEFKKIGVIRSTDKGKKMIKEFGELPVKDGGWLNDNAMFKIETPKADGVRLHDLKQVNIGLGKGKGIEIFNKNILEFEKIVK